MNYTLHTRFRYYLVRDYNLLTSPLVISLLVISAAAAAFFTLVLLFISDAAFISASVILLTSLAAAAALTLVFAATYYQSVPPRLTVAQLTPSGAEPINVAAASSFDLLRALGPASQRLDDASLPVSLAVLLNSPATDHLIRRLQLKRAPLYEVIVQRVVPRLTVALFAEGMVNVARELQQDEIAPEHALGAVLLHPAAQPYLRQQRLTDDDVRFVLWWGAEQRARLRQHRRWWAREQLLAFSGLGLGWAAGYTPLIDRLTRLPRGGAWDDSIHGHEDKLDALINSLARQRQSNVLLVGEPGVGRVGVIRHFARLIRANRAHAALNSQRLVYLHAGELIAQGASDAGQMTILARALREMERAGNIILIIDGLSSILGRSGEARLDVTDLLVPFLASRTVRVVVVISTEEYHLRLKASGELMQYFEVILLPPLSNEATLQRLALAVPAIERAAKCFIPFQTIDTLVEDTDAISPQVPFPERAFDFLEEAIVLAQRSGERQLEPRHVHQAIFRKIGIHLGELQAREKEQLLNLEALMHQRLVNQDAAVRAVARAMIRARAEIRNPQRPIGTFLFLGPTGVGKTETAKTLAEAYFGSEERMVRLDMSEFQGGDATARLIGSVERPVGRLTALIADHPFTVLLLDEFEKASREVHQLFLQVFDEGRLTDVAGRTYSFRHAIIIATSNAGAELIRQQAKGGQLPENFDATLKEHILRLHILAPELLNRIDAVITYTPLTREHLRRIAQLMLRSLNKRLDAEHGITVAVTDELTGFLVDIGYSPEFGARPMARAIQDTVEVAVSQQILRSEIQPGQAIRLPIPLLRSLRERPQ